MKIGHKDTYNKDCKKEKELTETEKKVVAMYRLTSSVSQ